MNLRKQFCTNNAAKLCKCLDISLDFLPMGATSSSIKGLITQNSRCCTITINSDIPEELQNIVCMHEIGHYVLKHNKTKGIKTFKSIYDVNVMGRDSWAAGRLENEANIFVSEYMISSVVSNAELQEYLADYGFFKTASLLGVPYDVLTYKIFTDSELSAFKLKCPVDIRSDCFGRIGERKLL